jgi:hypothetical protein
MNRRNFLSSSGGIAIATGISAGSILSTHTAHAAEAAPLPGLVPFSRDAFNAYIGEQFDSTDANNNLSGRIVLTAVVDVQSAAGQQQFSLTFSSSSDQTPLVSGTYTLYHPVGGTFDLYINATGIDNLNHTYRSDFSFVS